MEISQEANSTDSGRRRSSVGSTKSSTDVLPTTAADPVSPKLRVKPRPVRPGIEWIIGSRVEAMDSSNKWYTAKLIEIDDRDQTVLVHFDGWNQRYDEWLEMKSPRLRPIAVRSDKTKPDSQGVKSSNFKAGDVVLAAWSDSRMYPAKILRVNPSGSYEVVFFDGLKKTVKPLKVQALPRNVQKKYADAGLLSDIGMLSRHTRSTPAPSTVASSSAAGSVERSLTTSSEISSRRHSSSAMRSAGGVVSAALRRKAASFDSTSERRNDLVCETQLESPYFVPDKVSPSSASSTTSSRRTTSCVSTDVTSVANVDSSGAKDESVVEMKDECPLATSTGGISPAVCGVESASIVPVDVPTQVPTACTVTRSSDARTATRLRRCAISRSSTPKMADPSKVVLPDLNDAGEDTSHQCSTCQKTFRKQSLLECHIKYYHGGTGVSGGRVSRESVRQRSYVPVSGVAESTPARRTNGRISSTPLGQSNTRFTRRRFSSPALRALSVRNEHSSAEVMQFPPDVSADVEQNNSTLDSPQTLAIEDKLLTCKCNQSMDMSELIQCTCCQCYQHLYCLESIEIVNPEKYVCAVCRNPQGVRDSARYRYDCDWLFNGQMAKFSFASNEPNGAAKAKIMKATHDLVADVLNVMTVVDSIGREMHAVRHRVEPEFGHWKRNLDVPIDVEQSEKPTMPIETCGAITNGSVREELSNSDDLSLPNEVGVCGVESVENDVTVKNVTSDHPLQSSNETSSSEVKSADAITTSQCQSLKDGSSESSTGTSDTPVDNAYSNLAVEKQNSTNDEVAMVTDVGDETSTNSTGEHIVSVKPEEHETLGGIEEIHSAAENICSSSLKDSTEDNSSECNLMEHISRMQDTLDNHLSLIEKQVSALEDGEGNGNSSSSSDPLRDLSRVKKTVHQLISDLTKVNRISMYN